MPLPGSVLRITIAMAATAKDVARIAQVALPTAYEALRGDGRLSEATRQRVLDAARSLGYRPASAARAIRTRRTDRIGVVAKHHPVVMEIILGVNEVLQDRGKQLAIFPFDEHNADRIARQAFAERAFDGVMAIDLICPPLEDKCARETNCVWINTNRWAEHDCVRREEREAGEMVGQALARAGWKRWMFVCGRLRPEVEPHFSTAARLAGLRRQAEAHGAEVVEVRCQQTGVTTWRDLDAAVGPLDGRTAVVFNDNYRVRTMQNVLLSRGLMPGRNVAIVCCDDTDEFTLTWPGLSRVRFDRKQLGRIAAEMLIDRIRTGQPQPSTTIACRWHAGETLMPLPS